MHVLVLVAALQVLPAGPLVHGGLADAREPRTAVGIITSTLFADSLVARHGQGLPAGADAAEDRHGVVQLGTTLPLFKAGSAVISIQGGLIARFRIDVSDNDQLSSDFMVAVPVSYVRSAWEGRVRFIHRSAHLGDELVINTTLRRLEYDHEEVDAVVARRFGPFRVYGGGTLTVASSFDTDRWGWQLGVDGTRQVGAGWRFEAGLDYQRHSIQLAGRIAALAGLHRTGPAGVVALEAVYLTGGSPVGEFFLESERYWGVQVRLERSNGH